MKKIFIGIFLIAIFAAYAYHQKTDGESVTPQPNGLGQNGNASPIQNATGNSSQSQQSGGFPVGSSTSYKDGTYTGQSADAFYGNVQVKATISGGKITDVAFLQYPNDRGQSVMINQQATPLLRQEAIQNQTAQVDVVSGATQTSNAFVQSLSSALAQAK